MKDKEEKAKELVEKARIAMGINEYTFLRNPIWPDRCCRVALMITEELYKESSNDYWIAVQKEIEKL